MHIKLLLVVCFFIPLAGFIGFVIYYLPRKYAAIVLGLAGITVMTAGPFWALMIESRLREHFKLPRKRP